MSVVKLCIVAASSGRHRRRGSLGKNWKVFSIAFHGRKIEVAARTGWGYTAWSLTRLDGRTVRLWNAEIYKEMESMRKKVKPEAVGNVSHVAAIESSLLAKHHSIVAHCCVTKYDDGDPRVPGWISIRTFGQVWQVEAKDPDTCQFLRVQQPTIDDALTMMALLLDSPDAPWEHDPWASGGRGKKSRK